MIVGHYASALIPYSRLKSYPFWLLLLCANIPEFLWLFLAVINVEPVIPASLLDATFLNLQVHMTYSHNLIPGFIQGIIVGSVVYLFYRQKDIAWWCGFLTTFHVLSDAIIGFEHQLLGTNSITTSLNTYGNIPHLAIVMELGFSVVCVYWYGYSEKKSGRTMPKKQRFALYAVFIIGIMMWFPAATIPLSVMLESIGIL